ncbi:fasciclin-like arabinogalactan protein 4 [Lycium ferocissimum]|uniref:fasciclin-like arabinogalactan protein 4 n=1 Tax=Lycium ferocissimum TaxID=112874 RepID=UPI002814B5FC|nr:fasciclin-like arabinogalactan protein 4 [Lycium ferocissimum]
MAITIPISHFTPTTFLYFLLLSTSHPIFAINITNLLSSYPNLSDFTNILSNTSVTTDLAQRSSLTILAVPNNFLRRQPPSNAVNLADILRYHVLLEYLSWPDLKTIPPKGKVVTTLLQTTGRAPNNFGSVNITRNSNTNTITVHSPTSNATILELLKTLPYNISVFTVDSLLVPNGFDLMASETRPPLGLNITKTLIDGHNFNVAASMLIASGVEEEFERDEGGAGLTLFVPTDDAFSEMSSSRDFQSLPAEKKAVVLRFHVLHSYYPLGSLESIVNPVQPTLATEQNGAGSFTLNISRFNGSVGINTGIVTAFVTQTLFDQNPVAIFGVSKVLLPKEFFSIDVNNKTIESGVASPPEIPLSPEYSPGIYGGHLSSPPVLGNVTSSTTNVGKKGIFLWCIGFFYLLLLVIN